MDTDNPFEAEDVETFDGKTQTEPGSIATDKPKKKVSYEANADVQRWLKEQTIEEGGIKPEFHPTFLASLRDAPWIISSLAQFYEEDLITDVLHVVKSGKEATVYCCVAGPRTDDDYLAAKVYRPRMFRSLRNDAIYRQSRTQYDRDGRIVRGNGRHHQSGKSSVRDRAAQVSSWIEFEFQTQGLLYDIGAAVPKPVAQIGNALIMEYLGDVYQPALTLREVALTREEARPLFDYILHNVEMCLSYNRIHGDLSEYNILYWQGAVMVIDFAQAVDPRHNPGTFSLLVRDIERVCRYFARYGVTADAQELAIDMWSRYHGVL